MGNRKPNKWNWIFCNDLEKRRAFTKGYGLILLRPNTKYEETCFVEFKNGKPIHKRFPLRYYDYCIQYDVKPSIALLKEQRRKLVFCKTKMEDSLEGKNAIDKMLTPAEFKLKYIQSVINLLEANPDKDVLKHYVIKDNFDVNNSSEIESALMELDTVSNVKVAKDKVEFDY